MSASYTHPIAEVVRVVDGDTYWLKVDIDIGFRVHVFPLVNIRLLGWDCPEAHQGSPFERSRAVAARHAAATFLAGNPHLKVATEPDVDNFGRWLGRIFDATPGRQADLGNSLASVGLATPWPTRWRQIYDPLGKP